MKQKIALWQSHRWSDINRSVKFLQKLERIVKKNNSLLCVGLDSDFGKLPQQFRDDRYPQFAFNKAIVDSTYDLVCAYKPNSAFYEVRGEHGILQLKMTCDYIKQKHRSIVVILDAKRGDIGESNGRYERFAFEYLGADAITLHPYLGKEALQPFLQYKEKGCFILCRTSNPGAGEMQDLSVRGKPLYQVVAKMVASKWNGNRNCGLVVGATYPGELGIVRRIAPTLPLLVAGIGAQGGDLKKSVKFGIRKDGDGLIINASRSIIFAKSPREEAQKLRDEINKYRHS